VKLKTVSARTVPEAMAEVRQTLGDEAIIVSSLKMPSGGVQLVVATGKVSSDKQITQAVLKQMAGADTDERVRAVLNAHRVPDVLAENIIREIHTSASEVQGMLSEAFRNIFTFSPILPMKTQRAFLLTGRPASGKTTTLLKWALNAKRQKIKVALLSLDNQKAGAVSGLQSLTDVMHIPFGVVDDLSQLAFNVHKYRQEADLVLIDSVGLNPWQATDMAFLAEVNRACDGIEPVLTLPAGLDVLESGEIAVQFARLGCTRLIATGMDISGVYGNILNAACTANLALAYYTCGPMPTDELKPLSASGLADLLLQTNLCV